MAVKAVSGNANQTPATFTLAYPYQMIQVLNRGSSGVLWFTADGATVPSAGGAECYPVLPGSMLTITNPQYNAPVSATSISVVADTGTVAITLFGKGFPKSQYQNNG